MPCVSWCLVSDLISHLQSFDLIPPFCSSSQYLFVPYKKGMRYTYFSQLSYKTWKMRERWAKSVTGNISKTREYLLEVGRDSRGKIESRITKIGKKAKFQAENQAKWMGNFIKCVLNILELNEQLNLMFLQNTDGILRLCNPPQDVDLRCSDKLMELSL